MAVVHKGTAIAIWVICAVLLVVVVCLAIYLVCYRRRRRELRKLRRQLIQTDEVQTTINNNNNNESTGSPSRVMALRGHAGASEASSIFYPGFRRRTTEELEALPSPTQAASFPAPLAVYVRVRRDEAYMECCDILITVDRLRDSLPGDRSGWQVLGNDSYYHDDYLLYTNPLEFREAGTYVIHAFTVHPTKHIVGAVHQFTYVVTAGNAGGGVYPNFLALPNAGASNRHDNTVDIDIARRLAERGQASQPLSAISPNFPSMLMSGSAPASVYSTAAAVSHGAAVPPSSALQVSATPLPPVILPSGGEVTTSTDIVITPHELSTTPDQLRYSVDGSYPNLLYNGPFTLSLPPPSLLPSQRRTVIVKAIAIRATGGGGSTQPIAEQNVSPITRVVMQVRPAGFSYYDPQVPTPSMRLRAAGATLYFDESQNPPHTQTVYELVYVNQARSKVRYSRQRAQVYNGQPIVIPENVATVHAWTVMAPAAVSSASQQQQQVEEERVRSVPTIYDCSRAATERGKLSRRRVEQYHLQPDQLLPPPVMCVSCGDVELMFDDPPANGRIAYTLCDLEPALCDVYPPACAVPLEDGKKILSAHRRNPKSQAVGSTAAAAAASPVEGDHDGSHTFIYQPGKRIQVTQLETKQVYVTARVFVPIFEGSDGALYGSSGGQGGSCAGSGKLLGYRFGGVFHRGFYFNNQ